MPGPAQRLMVEVDADSEMAKALLAGDGLPDVNGMRVVAASEVPKRARSYMILVRDDEKAGAAYLDVGKTTTIKGVRWTVYEYVKQDEYGDKPEGLHGLDAF